LSSLPDLAKNAVRKILDEHGISVIYYHYTSSGKDSYGQPTYTVTNYTLKAVKESLGLNDVRFVEAGYLPDHYLYLYFHADDITFEINKIKDEIDYVGERYIIRNIFPFMSGDVKIYFKVLCRRKVVVNA